jgi:nitrite reductase (NO-forming)
MTDTTTDTTTETTAPAPVKEPSGTTFESLAVVGFVFGLFALVIAFFAVGLAARAVSEAGDGSGGGDAAEESGGGGGGTNALGVVATEFAFDPDEAAIAETGTITVENAGTIEHDLVIEDLTTGPIAAGETGEVVVEGLEPGEYDYYCSIPGHREAGMEGHLEVG